MIHYLKGDATQPRSAPPWVLTHIVNDRGGWGKGFVLDVSKRWDDPEVSYRTWSKLGEEAYDGVPFELGYVQFVRIWPGGPLRRSTPCFVANMLAQHGYRTTSAGIPLRYDALRQCLAQVREFANIRGASVHMPRIGCGLAGGSWETVKKLIAEELQGTEVFIYTLE